MRHREEQQAKHKRMTLGLLGVAVAFVVVAWGLSVSTPGRPKAQEGNIHVLTLLDDSDRPLYVATFRSAQGCDTNKREAERQKASRRMRCQTDQLFP